MAKTAVQPPLNRTFATPYSGALDRVLDYLHSSSLWDAERADFESGDTRNQAFHTFSAFQALRAFLMRGLLDVELGRVVTTPGVIERLDEEDISGSINRHRCGDWGDLHYEDWEQNETAFKEGRRLLSRYHSPIDGETFWVITEADRSVTTVLLPEEY